MIIQQLINGLTIGSIYAMVALGYTLAYGILGLINFAHGDVYMVGAFIAYFCVSVLKINIIVSFFAALIVSGILGALIEFTAFRTIRSGSRSSQLISAIGVSIILQNTVMLTMGSDTKPFPKVMNTAAYEFSNITISSTQILIMIVALVFMIMLYLLIYKTRIGIAMRSTAQDSAMSSLMGINVNKVISITFSIGAVLGAAAGILVGIYYNSLVFNMGASMGLKAFVAAVLGGIGNIPGTMLGGIVLGLAESLGATLISAKYKDAFSFIILILVLLFKPTGLFGKKEVEKV
ncbi:branched-chain amino acid ABC transporter permease [Sedimentibacter sp.]|uniref:branched-chain amino acid ABC transporter permease n=1 Tax=Sedimentibacter sp. TaxID=1960295 RepID=UPI0028AD8C11|nr:branched-chain amino acid ABC transporter permease [Sedimentibacter sp.]